MQQNGVRAYYVRPSSLATGTARNPTSPLVPAGNPTTIVPCRYRRAALKCTTPQMGICPPPLRRSLADVSAAMVGEGRDVRPPLATDCFATAQRRAFVGLQRS